MKHVKYSILCLTAWLLLAVAPLNPIKAQDAEMVKYYVNGAVSLRISPWKEGRRFWYLYDLKGNETIRLEEIRLSYSVSYDADYYGNGAVRTIKIHENPGASMYWYEGVIRFSTTNEPIEKAMTQMPERHLTLTPKPWLYWDKKTRSWKEQEVIECNPIRD
jgi:hypothetical protein